MDLCIPRVNQTTFDLKSFRYEAVKQWNSLPENVKRSTDLQTIKRLIKTWDGPACHCNFCMSTGTKGLHHLFYKTNLLKALSSVGEAF